MKVYIIGNPWEHENAQRIYQEALRQEKSVSIGFLTWPWKHLIRDVKNFDPDWVLVTGSRSLNPDQLKELSSMAKLVIWDADALCAERNKIWDAIRGIPNIIFTVVTNLDNTLADQVLWMPQYFDDEYYKPTVPVSVAQIYDVIFLGSLDDARKQWIEELNKKYRVFHSDSIFGPETSNLYRQSKISFGIWRDGFEAGDFATSDRIYRAMGAGCFHLLHPVNNVELLFEPEVHLDMYDGSLDLLIEQIDYYLENHKARNRIAEKGRYEILQNHTLKVRLKQYWEAMENYK